MALLIIIKQKSTGVYNQLPEIPENEIFDIWYFDTNTKEVNYDQVRGGREFELELSQLVYKDPVTGTEYYYDGPDVNPPSVSAVEAPPAGEKTYELLLRINPKAGGSAQNLSGSAFNIGGTEILIQATPNQGWLFVNWTNGGELVSIEESFTFIMPPAYTTLTANFVLENPPVPEPDEVFEPVKLADNAYYLEIRTRGVQIPLQNITQKIVTGLFSDEFTGDYSYPVTITVTDEVKLALRLPNDPQSAWNFSKNIPAELWGHGNRIYRGFLNILTGGEKSVRANFVFLSGFFIEDNKTRKVADCYDADDIVTLDGPVVAVGGYEIRFNFRDFQLKANSFSKIFFQADYEGHIEMMEDVFDWLGSLPLNLEISIQYSDDLLDESSRIFVWEKNITANIELTVLNSGTTTGGRGGFSASGSRYSRARRLTNSRFVMTNWNESNEENRIAFPQFYNRNLYDANNPIHDGIVNRYDSEGRLYYGNVNYLSYSESFRWEHTIIPFIYLTDIVKHIFKYLKIEVTGDFFDNDIVKKLVVYNNRTLDFVQVSENGVVTRRTSNAIYAGDENFGQTAFRYENVHNFNIKLKNHVPDLTITDFLKFMKNYLNLKYDFNVLQNRVEIRFVRDIYRKARAIDMSKYASRVYALEYEKEQGIAFTYRSPDPIMQDGNTSDFPSANYTVPNFLALNGLNAEIDELAYVRSLKAYFRLTPNTDEEPTWKLKAFDQRDDDSENKVSWEVGMVPMVDGFFNNRKMPAIEATAWQPEINLFNRDTGLRVTAFYGMQADGEGGSYAFASSTKYNGRELADSAQYELDVRGKDIYPLWQDTEKTLTAAKLYETNLLITEQLQRKLSQTTRIQIANIEYLIRDMEITNTFREFSMVRVWMYKV